MFRIMLLFMGSINTSKKTQDKCDFKYYYIWGLYFFST